MAVKGSASDACETLGDNSRRSVAGCELPATEGVRVSAEVRAAAAAGCRSTRRWRTHVVQQQDATEAVPREPPLGHRADRAVRVERLKAAAGEGVAVVEGGAGHVAVQGVARGAEQARVEMAPVELRALVAQR